VELSGRRSFGWPHRFIVRPWDELRPWYRDLAETHPGFGYLDDIVVSVVGSGVADLLAATTSMHDLVVIDHPVPEPPMEVVVVRAPSSLRRATVGVVRLEHQAHTGRDDVVERPVDRAVPLFWRFVREKLGIVPAEGGP
jgi:hypothetical protein